MMEDRDFFPAALEALEPQDWTEIASALTSPEDPLFSEAAEETFEALRARILQLEQEAEAERDQARDGFPHQNEAFAATTRAFASML